MLGLIFGALMFAQCINPNLSIEVCGTPTEMPTLEATPTLAPTETPEVVPTETPTPAPTDTPLPTETPTPRPTLAPTDTPEPRATPTLRPTAELRTRRPTLEPGPERARLPECLAAPPAVPDVPGIRDASWTNAQRCGGTPEALATRYVQSRPTLSNPVQSEPPDRVVLVVPVVILPPIVVTETPTAELMIRRSDETPTDDDEAPRVPVQLPEGGDS